MSDPSPSPSPASSPSGATDQWLRDDPLAALDRIQATQAEKSLAEYVRQAWPLIEPGTTYLPNWHIDYICEYLEAITLGQLTRVIFNIPPRYMKSTVITIMWPTWEWIRMPWERWIFISFAKQLSTMHSMQRRAILQSEWYQRRWGHLFTITTDQNQKTEYDNNHRGKHFASSIGGDVHGGGGNRLVVDDPHDPEQAESDVERETGIRFFDRTLYPRLNDKHKGAIVVVMQRLHQKDLTGHLERQGRYTVVKVPGEVSRPTVFRFPRSAREVRMDPGQPLWPAREDRQELDAAQAAMGAYAYAGQYLQVPAPPGGSVFVRDDFIVIPRVPSDAGMLWIVRFWDKAATLDGDWSAGCLMAKDSKGRYYILHMVRGRWRPSDRERLIGRCAATDGRDVEIYIAKDPGQAGIVDVEATIRTLAGYLAFAYTESGSKLVRARAAACQVEAHNVYLIEGEWNRDFLDEAEMFPNGLNDDQVDSFSGAFANLVGAGEGSGRAAVAGERGNYYAGQVLNPLVASIPSSATGRIPGGVSAAVRGTFPHLRKPGIPFSWRS